MNTLEQFLNNAARQYYAGTPIISDEQFDKLAELAGYDAIGAKQHANKSTHYKRMFSLQKYYEDEGVKPLQEYRNLCVSPKLDGAAVSHLYVDGVLVQSLTRGDGVEGQIVTDKFLNSKFVPSKIDLPEHKILQVTGELVAPMHIENARNYAAGALNLGNVDEFRTRAVEFFAYGVFPYITYTFTGDMRALGMQGFQTVLGEDIDKVYPTDGLVFRIDNNDEFEECGYTAKHPKGAYAKKTRAAHVETTLLDVVWQTGKSGKVTPVALLEPVLIGDALVSRATLNNGAFIKALDLRIGDRVAVIRAGEIIPQVLHKIED